MRKSKHKSHPLCVRTQTHSLSTEAAVQVLEFLETSQKTFLAQYGHKIHRHYAKRVKRHINVHEPWKGDCTDDLF